MNTVTVSCHKHMERLDQLSNSRFEEDPLHTIKMPTELQKWSLTAVSVCEGVFVVLVFGSLILFNIFAAEVHSKMSVFKPTLKWFFFRKWKNGFTFYTLNEDLSS